MSGLTLADLCRRMRPELAALGDAGLPLLGVLTVVERAGTTRSADALADPIFALDVLGMAGPGTDAVLVGRVLDYLRLRGVDQQARQLEIVSSVPSLTDAVAKYEAGSLALADKGTERTYRTWNRRLTESRPGWVRNAANDWTVRFGPISPGGTGGVEVVTGAGPVRFAPELPAGHPVVSPVVGTGDDADTVTYEDVWPGVDIRYVVTGGRVKEDIVVADDARSSFPFVTEGLGLVESTVPDETSAVEVTSLQAEEVELLAPEVIDADGSLAGGDAAAEFAVGATTSGWGSGLDFNHSYGDEEAEKDPTGVDLEAAGAL